HARGDAELVAPRRGHAHRLAAVAFEQAFALEQAVGLRDGHRVHRVGVRHVAHRGQLGAGDELATRDHAPHLLNELLVDGYAGVGVEDEHACDLVYAYNRTLSRTLSSTRCSRAVATIRNRDAAQSFHRGLAGPTRRGAPGS